MNIIGICGAAGSGKDTVADILAARYGFAKLGLADPMKKFLRELYDFTTDQLWGPSASRNAPDHRYPREHSTSVYHGERCDCCGANLWEQEIKQCYLTPRFALQRLGTEWGRSMHSATWISYLIRKAPYIVTEGTGVAVSDIRFPNELQAIRNAGGRIWHRPGGGLTGSAGAHASEAGFGNLKFDAEIPWQDDVKNLDAVVARLMEVP
jgi:hypothetical protein